MTNSAVVIKDLRVERGGREVLRSVSLDVPSGAVTGLLGPSGCGKTTLLRSIVGVQIVAGGTVTVLGAPAGSPSLRDKVGYATQNPALYTDLTVAECLRYFASVLGAPQSDVARVIAEVDLQRHADKVIGVLSGGERSRTSLAVALLGKPQLLVLDEPTVGLDPVLRDDLWTLFHRLAQGGVTLLVSSHVMDEAARCQQLVLMRDGAILATASPDELRARTGSQDMDAAFLRLIREQEAGVR
jgi:ABC-2 type transport system ATP-binding protein